MSIVIPLLVVTGLALYMFIGIAMIVGALRMMRLQSYGWAMTATIAALLPVSPASLLGLAMGIWSLVVLNRPAVRAAFPRATRKAVVARDNAGRDSAGLGKASLWLSILGVILPLCLWLLIGELHQQRGQQIETNFAAFAALFLVLELGALGCGIVARRTPTGKAGLIISAILLLLFPLVSVGFTPVLDSVSEADPAAPPEGRHAPQNAKGAFHGMKYVELAAFDARISAPPAGEPFPPPTHVAFSTDGKILIALVGIHKHAWEVESKTDLRRRRLGDFISKARSGTLAPDGKTITLMRPGGEVELWAIEDEVQIARFKTHDAADAAIFSPDGKRAVVSVNKGWLEGMVMRAREDVGLGPRLDASISHTGLSTITALAYARNGVIASGGVGGEVEAYRVSGGSFAKVFKHNSPATCVALDRDAKRVAAGFADGAVRVWEVVTGKLHARLGLHPGVTSVAFAPDGRLIATGSTDGTVKLWAPAVE